MKRFAFAAALACVFSVSALAGDVPSGGFAPPEPEVTQNVTVGEPNRSVSDDFAEEALARASLGFLETVLAVFSA